MCFVDLVCKLTKFIFENYCSRKRENRTLEHTLQVLKPASKTSFNSLNIIAVAPQTM